MVTRRAARVPSVTITIAPRKCLADLTERFAIGADDRVLWVSSLAFDLSIFDIFGLLGAGGAVVVPPPRGQRDPRGWMERIHRHSVTIWDSVPALAELALTGSGASELLGSLRLVMMSGDWIPVSLPNRLREASPRATIYSLGGATEASIWSIFLPIDQVDPQWTSIPYGTPLRNQTFHVLKPDLTRCPIHACGKLFIGGVGLARDYWRNPDQTRARFIHHPTTGQRLYDAGTLAIARTARSSFSAARISRSRSAVSVSSSAKSKRLCSPILTCRQPWRPSIVATAQHSW